MADSPILFSGLMVRALLAGNKTQTRRIIHPEPATTKTGIGSHLICSGPGFVKQISAHFRPRFAAGDRLYVREAWRSFRRSDHIAPRDMEPQTIWWEADGDGPLLSTENAFGRLRASMHMPRWASRITLTVTNVRVHRLQEINEADALAEGVPEALEGNIGDEVYCPQCRGDGVHPALGANLGVIEVDCAECATAKLRFHNLWDSLNASRGYGWDANPWVTATTFTVRLGNIDEVGHGG